MKCYLINSVHFPRVVQISSYCELLIVRQKKVWYSISLKTTVPAMLFLLNRGFQPELTGRNRVPVHPYKLYWPIDTGSEVPTILTPLSEITDVNVKVALSPCVEVWARIEPGSPSLKGKHCDHTLWYVATCDTLVWSCMSSTCSPSYQTINLISSSFV
jgi:hypothetical protein